MQKALFHLRTVLGREGERHANSHFSLRIPAFDFDTDDCRRMIDLEQVAPLA